MFISKFLKILIILLACPLLSHPILAALSFEDIIAEEAKLEQALERQTSEGNTPKAYSDSLAKIKSILTDKELESFLSQGPKSIIDKDKRAKVNIEIERLRAVHHSYKEVQNQADNFMLDQLNYILVNSKRILIDSVESIQGDIDSKQYDEIVKKLEKVKKYASEYEQEKVRFGTGKDVIRRNTFLKYFMQAKLLVIDIQTATGSPTRQYTLRQTIPYTIRKTLKKINILIKLIRPAIRTLHAYYFPRKSANGVLNHFPEEALKTIRALADTLKISVNIDGLENLPSKIEDTKVVTIYTPTHRHPLNDVIIMERIQREIDETAITYAATRNFAPPKIADGIASHPAVIPVGSTYDDPTQRLLKTLKEQTTRSVFLYPEAGVHSGIQNTLPIRDQLSIKLFQSLRAEGYKIQIVPITYLDASRTLDQTQAFEPSSKGYTLHAKVHTPIDKELVDLMYLVDEVAVTRHMRAVMLQNLPTDANRILGMLRPEQSIAELFKFVAKDCSRSFKFLLEKGIPHK
jgi:hypothetical protein